MKRIFMGFFALALAISVIVTWLAVSFIGNPYLRVCIVAAVCVSIILSGISFVRVLGESTAKISSLWEAGREAEAIHEAGTMEWTFAAHLMETIQKERTAARSMERKYRLLMDIINQLHSTSDPSADLVPVLMRIMQGIESGTGFERLFLFFYDQNSNFIPGGLHVSGSEQELEDARARLDFGGDWAARIPPKGQTSPVILESGPGKTTVLVPIEDLEGRSSLLVAEVSGDSPSGAEQGSKTLVEMSEYINFAVREAEMLEKLFARAHWDPTTSTFKHSYLHDRIHDEIDRAKRYDYKFSLAIVSIRDSKTPGSSPDENITARLAKLGNLIHNNKRSIDLLARFGDEHLALLLPQTTENQAVVLAHRLAELAGRELGLDVLLGIVEYPTCGLQPLELTDNAFILLANPDGPNIRSAAGAG